MPLIAVPLTTLCEVLLPCCYIGKGAEPSKLASEAFPANTKLSEKETCAKRRYSNLYIQQFEINPDYIMDKK